MHQGTGSLLVDITQGSECRSFLSSGVLSSALKILKGTKKNIKGYLYQTVIVNPLWPSNTIWQHRSELTLAQVMARCLTAASHYLNQCWLRCSVAVTWEQLLMNLLHNMSLCVRTEVTLKITATYPRGQWVNRNISIFHAWWWFTCRNYFELSGPFY